MLLNQLIEPINLKIPHFKGHKKKTISKSNPSLHLLPKYSPADF